MAAITRQTAKIDLTVNRKEKDAYLMQVREILNSVSSIEAKRQVAEAASGIVIDSARRVAKTSFKNQRVHHAYDTPKLFSNLRAPDGMGVKVATYTPGNLMRSIIDIAKRRSSYKKKTSKVIIGPYYRGRGPLGGAARKIFNSMSKIDGYYAHMVYKSARAFQQQIMIPGLLRVRAQVVNEMKNEAQKILAQEASGKSMIEFKKG